jgi:hypothetical protein
VPLHQSRRRGRVPGRQRVPHRVVGCVDGDVVADAAGDVVLKAEADDAVMVGLKRLPQVGPVAPAPGRQRELHRGQAISQRHLIGGRQWLAFLLIGAMARSSKG